MNEIHFEYEGKAARLSLQSLKREKAQPAVRRRTSTGEVSMVRVLNGQSQSIDKEKLTPDDLINGDPEIEIESGGTLPELELFTPAYLLPGENVEIAHEFSEIEIVHTPEGEEKERRPRVLRSSNINDVHPIKFGKTFPIEKHSPALYSVRFTNLFMMMVLATSFCMEWPKDYTIKRKSPCWVPVLKEMHH